MFCNTTIALLFSSWLLATSTAQFFHRPGQSLWLERCVILRSQRRKSFTASASWTGSGSCSPLHASWCVWGRAPLLPGVPALQRNSPCPYGRLFVLLAQPTSRLPSEQSWTDTGRTRLRPWQTTILPPGPRRRQNPTVRGHRTDNSDFIQNWHSSCALPMHRAATPSGVIFQRLVR